MKSYIYKEETFYSVDELISFLAKEGTVTIVRTEPVDERDITEWDADRYVEAAKKHYTIYEESDDSDDCNHPDELVKAAQKIWQAAILTMKEVFLKIGINVISEDRLKQLCDRALESNMDLFYGWEQTKDFQVFVEKKSGISRRTFLEYIYCFEAFQACFKEMTKDEEKTLREMVKQMGTDDKNMKVEEKSGIEKIGNKNYQFDFEIK